jgi:sulfur-carrier protein
MITVKFFTTLQVFLRKTEVRFNFASATILQLLDLCEKQSTKPFLHKLLDTQRTIIPGTIILLNGHNILHLHGLETLAHDGDEIALFPPGGGG